MKQVIVLCNGVDDSLLGTDFGDFEFKTASEREPEPIEERRISYIYRRKKDPEGCDVGTPDNPMKVRTVYDFISHMFATHSTAQQRYSRCPLSKNNDPDEWGYTYFQADFGENVRPDTWYAEAQCLLDAIRLFKPCRAGFGLGLTTDGIGVNDQYQWETNWDIDLDLPVFSLNAKEKKIFPGFYRKFREWYFQHDVGSKDRLTKTMLGLFRNAYRCNDVETAFISISGIWELFSQQFPEIGSPIGDGVSERIRQSVSRMVRNGGEVRGKKQNNLYMKIKYLYKQRSIIVHKGKDEVFDEECTPMAFDLTRCLILKLFYAKDREIEDVVTKLEYCDKEEAAYKVDPVRWMPASDKLMDRIFSPVIPTVRQSGPRA